MPLWISLYRSLYAVAIRGENQSTQINEEIFVNDEMMRE